MSGAQQHAVTFAAGLAVAGLKPVVAISSTALQRAYDQLIHDVALQGLPVMFAVDHAGLAGGELTAYHGAYDLSYLRCVPHLTIMAPADENECREMLHGAYRSPGPAVVRFPCGQGPRASLMAQCVAPAGRARLCREGGSGLALLSFGALLEAAAGAAERLAARAVRVPLLQVGIPERFSNGGSRASCLAAAQLDAPGLSETIERWWQAQDSGRARATAAG